MEKFGTEKYEKLKAFPLFVGGLSDVDIERYRSDMPNVVSLMGRKDINGQDVFRYICLVYDISSPYRFSVPLLGKRKQTVVRDLEMGDKLGKDCMELTDRRIASAIADFLKFQDDRTWRLILQNEEVFSSNEMEIMVSMAADEKDKDRFQAAKYRTELLKQQDGIRIKLQKLYTDITGNDPLAAKLLEARMYDPETVAGMLGNT